MTANRITFDDDEPKTDVTIAMRIPGKWSSPQDLVESLPPGCRWEGETFVFPDGTNVDFNAVPADDEFAKIFRSACRQPPTQAELAIVDQYAVNVLLRGPGGSLESARAMMHAAAFLVNAGGAGVFIDNCALAHGGENWLEMTEDGGSDALSFAFVSIVRGQTEVWTMGMHALGFREILMKRSDIEIGGFDIVEVIRYVCQEDKSIGDGHILADLDGPRFKAVAEESDDPPPGSPMHNPFGRLRLVSMRDIAEKN